MVHPYLSSYIPGFIAHRSTVDGWTCSRLCIQVCNTQEKGKGTWGKMNQKERFDVIFREINIEQNGFHFLNYLAYWALRVGGFMTWNGHRKNDKKK